MASKNLDEFVPEFLYIEEFEPPTDIQDRVKKKQEEDDVERGIVIIEIF